MQHSYTDRQTVSDALSIQYLATLSGRVVRVRTLARAHQPTIDLGHASVGTVDLCVPCVPVPGPQPRPLHARRNLSAAQGTVVPSTAPLERSSKRERSNNDAKALQAAVI